MQPPGTYPLPPELSILDAETLTEFGYHATQVSPGALQKVVCRCTGCHRPFSRIRRRLTTPALCNSCSRTKAPRPLPSFVNPEATRKEFGYDPAALTPGSNDKVVADCPSCQCLYAVRRKSVRDDGLCRSCAKTLSWAGKAQTCARCAAPFIITARSRRSSEVETLCAKCRPNRVTRNSLPQAPEGDLVTSLNLVGEAAHTVSPHSHEKVAFACDRCGGVTSRARRELRAHPLCSTCARGTRNPLVNATSAGELELLAFLESLGVPCTQQFPLQNGQSLDLVSLEHGLALEYCGLHWHHEADPGRKGPKYHRDRMMLAGLKGLRLLTMFEDEWKTRRSCVEARLRAILGKNERRLGARSCELRALTRDEAHVFLDAYHLQGAPVGTWGAWGLWDRRELVLAMTLGAHPRQGHDTKAVLSRLCTLPNLSVAGGASRLLVAAKEAARARGCTSLLSWSDNRWSRGDVYMSLGFTLEEELPPDYGYVDIKHPRERLSKQSQKKSNTGCPPDRTEHSWALEHGLARIWDCGHKRWVLPL